MKKISPRLKIWLYLSIPIVLLLIFFSMLAHLAWAKKYESRIYPGISIGNISLGGLTEDEARQKIDAQAEILEKDGLNFELNGKKINIPKEAIADSIDFTQESFSINRNLTLKNAFDQGRDNDWLTSFSRWIFGDWKTLKLEAVYNISPEVITTVLKNNYSDQEISSENASLKLNNKEEIEVVPEKDGLGLNYEDAIEKSNHLLANLGNETIYLKTEVLNPETTTEDLNELLSEAEEIIQLAPIKIKAKDYYSTVNKTLIISWIKTNQEGKIDFDREKIKAFILKDLSSRFDQEAEEPRFKIVSGRMSFWQAGVEGRKINLEKSAEKIVQEILNDHKKEIDLELEIIPVVSMEEGDVVIKELLGTGHSNFAGSSSSRKKNIAVGANAVQGLLIKPGEEFSLVKQLGDVSEESGYYPELVIKGNKTVREFGGGLCQVATTLFRSALATGLPITARQNHSYRVSYYEPAGTDAAVYIPNPDVRFVNDTKNYILIQSRISGNNIYFDFWGVKDGRVASSTEPTIYNIVKPAPKKTIVSQDLKPGETKCTESAHNGADAYFDYTVTYADGKVATKRFKSHYVPWQAVCLVGPTPTTTKPVATSTPPVTTPSTTTATSTTSN